MNKKVLAIAVVLICAASLMYFSISSKNKNTSPVSQNADKKVSEFKVKSAFADVDLDMTIQDKDDKDEDTSGDYVFIYFTSEVSDNKKTDDSNVINLNSYKLDNNSLPSDSKIYFNNKNEVIIKLPNGYLKGLNTPHTLDISKNLLNKNGAKIKGDLNIKLPYSKTIENNSSSTSKDKSKTDNTTDNTSNSNNKNASGTTQNSNVPKYTVELSKSVPFSTIVMVKLDTPNPENYKVSIEGNELTLRKNSKGEQVFVNGIKKVYELDQINQLIKIEKIK